MNREDRAKAAAAALKSEVLMSALDALEQDAVEGLLATDLPDAERREICYMQHLGLKQVRQTLENWSRDTKGRAT
jgi:hypothetical protein